MRKAILILVMIITILPFSGCTDESKKTINTKSIEQTDTHIQDAYKLSLDDINRRYTDSKILNIQNIKQEHVLVESQQDTFANRFDLYNLKTGNMDTLPTMLEFVTLEKIENENYFVFLASGRNSESPFSQFPFTIKCIRIKNDIGSNDNFTVVYEDKYLSLDESAQAGSKEGSIMSDLNITFEGFEVLFKPLKGKEVGFYADATDIPPTKTSYDKSTKKLTFEIGTQYLGESLKGRKKVITNDNQYISSYEIIQKDNKIYLVVGMRDSAKRYFVSAQTI
jgi:hypothetical protein